MLFSWWTELAPMCSAPRARWWTRGSRRSWRWTGRRPAASLEELVGEADGSTAFDVVVSPVASTSCAASRTATSARTASRSPRARRLRTAAAATLERLRAIAADPRVRLHACRSRHRVCRRCSRPASGHTSTAMAPRRRDVRTPPRRGAGHGDRATPGLEFDRQRWAPCSRTGSRRSSAPTTRSRDRRGEFDFAPPPAASIAIERVARTALLPNSVLSSSIDRRSVRTNLSFDSCSASSPRSGRSSLSRRRRARARARPRPDAPGRALASLPGRLTDAPFMEAVNAEDLATRVRPRPPPAWRSPPGFSPAYADDLAAAPTGSRRSPRPRRARPARRTASAGADYAESSQFIENEGSGRACIHAVNGVTTGRCWIRSGHGPAAHLHVALGKIPSRWATREIGS